jgi:hypothetical protein
METDLESVVDLVIDFKLVVDGSVMEYKDRVVVFSCVERVDHDDTLVMGISQKEGVGLVEVDASIV